MHLNVPQDRKVRLNEWDGKSLKEIAVLEGNQGVVSALAFSPNGKYLASGDVGFFLIYLWRLLKLRLLVVRKGYFVRRSGEKGMVQWFQ